MAQFLELVEDIQFTRHCRRVNNQGMIINRFKRIVDHTEVVRIVYRNTFGYQPACQIGFRFVIPSHQATQMTEIACQGAHADATDSDEVSLPDVVYVRYFSVVSYLLSTPFR